MRHFASSYLLTARLEGLLIISSRQAEDPEAQTKRTLIFSMSNLEGRSLYAVIFAASFIGFCIMFFVAWGVSAYVFRRMWPTLLVTEKADWASRVNSQIHAFIVVIGFLITLNTTSYDYRTWYNDAANVVPSSVIMAISLGYFSFDFFVLVYYRFPLWIVFVGHHLVASSPFFTYLFHPCESGNIVLSCFLLVEFATIFLNFQTWMEKLGYAKTKWFTWMFYMTYISWFLTRVLLPVFLVYIVWNLWLSDVTLSRGLRVCLIPGFVCSHLITVFCWVVFFFVLTPDMLQRWKETPEAVEERLNDAKKRRRRQLRSQDAAMSRSQSPDSVHAAPRSSSPAAGTATRSNVDEIGVDTSLPSREQLDIDIDSEREDEREEAPDAINEPIELGEIDYQLLLRTMLADNPYVVRPEGRTELSMLSFDDLRREGATMENRTTAYATTTLRL